MPTTCYDCGLSYDDFPCDMVIQDEAWELIAPVKIEGYKGGGLLCPNCICKRLCDLGLTAVKVTIDLEDIKERI